MHTVSTSYTPLLHRVMRMDLALARLWCFIAALAVYAAWGLPTPDDPGLAEVVIAVLLAMAAGSAAVVEAFRFDPRKPVWEAAGSVLLIYALSMPLIMAVVAGNEARLILRDLIPFLFLLLPLFIKTENERAVLGGVLLVGVFFSIRAVAEKLQMPFSGDGELTYLANAPTVLFAALFFAGAGGKQLLEKFTARSLLIFLFCIGIAMITILPPVLTAQRASIGYAALYICILSAVGFYYYPYRAAALFVVIVAAAIPAFGVFENVAAVLAQKNTLAGFNMRFEELAAVWETISKSPFTLLFGAGWGGTFESPAVAEIRVNFTHSLLTGALLKTGLAGFILISLYVLALLKLCIPGLRVNPVLGLALAGPVLIDVFLYASYKSLDFGLILLLIALLGRRAQKVA